MSSAAPLMLRLLSASVCSANKAGVLIREVLKSGNLGVVEKGSNDPQTEADRRAQKCIVTTLEARFPGLRIVGEEDITVSDEDRKLGAEGECEEVLKEQCPTEYSSVDLKDVTVWVDPLDGTREFTEGFPEHVTTLIGISVSGKPVGGVIYQPFFGSSGRTVWGMVGVGMRGTELKPREGEGLVITVTRSHMSKPVQDTVDNIKPLEVIRAGGCGNKILKVLEGVVNAYVYPSIGTKKWDACAGDAILRAVGGRLTDIRGREIVYENQPDNIMNKSGLLVTLTGHDQFLAMVPDHVKALFP